MEKLITSFHDCKEKFKNNKIKWIPNILTIIRVVAIIPISILLILDKTTLAFVIAFIAALTDLFDGMLARKLDAYSDFGARMDTVSDKMLTLTFLLIILKYNFNYLMIIIIILEALIAITNLRADKLGYESHTLYIGKVKTFILYSTLILYLIDIIKPLNQTILLILLVISIILEIITVITYIKRFIKQKR
jgi:cardiolipin synthase